MCLYRPVCGTWEVLVLSDLSAMIVILCYKIKYVYMCECWRNQWWHGDIAFRPIERPNTDNILLYYKRTISCSAF